VRIVSKLVETGYDFDFQARIRVYVTDTLTGPERPIWHLHVPSAWDHELKELRRTAYEEPITVVLGNPPFSGISDHRGQWIDGLLKGSPNAEAPLRGYYHVDGQPLGERKVWLQDDYVKFFRYAHWKIERSGCGIIGFITNHGYLDNISFRGMRQRLIESFPQITVVDLHGNRKKQEATPSGGVDESVFLVEQGVAIGLFRKPPGQRRAEVRHFDLWGTRQQKTRVLVQQDALEGGRRIAPQSPHYLLKPRDAEACEIYERAMGLQDVMPVNSTAAVTARDRFVIAFHEEELLNRMRLFRDLSIPTSEIRRRFFTNSRSAKYLPGDTRGWKLEEARRIMAEDAQWDDYVRPCLYRPFDRRVVYWTSWMIDWPRQDAMRFMSASGNLALVTRRQMLAHQPCNFFWIADSIVIDGVVRSDNRGSESFFPLFLPESAAGDSMPVNFAPAFVELAAQSSGMRWDADRRDAGDHCFGPLDLLAYIYGLFHAPSYRRRYAEWFCLDFPRVLLPGSGELFRGLSQFGRRLLDLHLGQVSNNQAASANEKAGHTGQAPVIGPGYPKHVGERVLVNKDFALEGVSRQTWQFCVGSHQVCKKWLRDRRGRSLEPSEVRRFQEIVSAIKATLHTMQEIDKLIQHHGGCPGAFMSR
jgi:predicted helicase